MENHIIIGAKVTDRIRENLDHALPAHQFYFKDNNPDYLQILRIEGEQVIGKKVASGLNVKQLDDYASNVISILRKVCPDYRWSESEIRVFAQTLIG